MIQRCSNPNTSQYEHYGARGITVFPEWRASFVAFIGAVGRRPSDLHSLDRFPDVNGNFEPGNVRWATDEQQGRNKRNNIIVQYKGQPTLLIEACEDSGADYVLAKLRRHRGWPDEQLFIPPKGVPALGAHE